MLSGSLDYSQYKGSAVHLSVELKGFCSEINNECEFKGKFDATLTNLMARDHNDHGDDDYYDNHQCKDADHNQSNMPPH